MSLFGDDNDAPARQKSSLFDDEPSSPSKKKAHGSSSIFADTAADNDQSPWGFTPKKNTGRGSLVKSLLADADVPDLYIDTFDAIQRGGSVQSADAQQLLAESGVTVTNKDKIWSIISAGGNASNLGRPELNVLIALIGLAKEGEEVSLDSVDERRKKLPLPDLPSIQSKRGMEQPPAAPQPEAEVGAQSSPQQPASRTRKPSFGLDNDPWASPELHKGHKHLNGFGGGAQRTTSNFTTTSAEPAETNGSYGATQTSTTSEGASSWGASGNFNANSTAGFGGPVVVGGSGGFGEDGNTPNTPARRPAQPRVSNGAEELVTVNTLEEKEGMFMFQHRNYEVASARRNSKVIRRYSDFVWLLDCLHKRYPFRQLPLLPPKRVAINGNHIAADNAFLEKRRRGLARFANALVRHPVLREEQLVVMFLTVPTVEASPLRKPFYNANFFIGIGSMAQAGYNQCAGRVRWPHATTDARRQLTSEPAGDIRHGT